MKSIQKNIAIVILIILMTGGLSGCLIAGESKVYAANDGHWETVGTAGFSEGAIVAEGSLITTVSIDVHAGIPYVAYADESKDGKLVVQKYNGSAWEYVGDKDGISNTSARGISLVLYDGSPYVAYTGKEDLGADKVFVKKYNGTTWVPLEGSTGLVGYTHTTTTSLSVYEGIPYVAFANIAGSVKPFELNANKWTDLWTSASVKGTSISIDVYEGIPYVAYMSSPPLIPRAMVAKLDENTWESLGPASPSMVGAEKTIMKLDNGTPYVAYFSQQSKATVMKYSGSGVDWVPVGAAEFSPSGSYTAFDLAEGIPYLSFMDKSSRKATVMTFDGSEWKTVGTSGFSEGEANNLSLAVDGESVYLAYLDKANGNKVTVMKNDITDLPQVSKPIANPKGGELESGTPVELTTATEEATIYYTIDESDPTSSSTEYTAPIEITEELTIKAIAVKDGMSESEVMEEQYTILPPEQVERPVASPAGGTFTSGTPVELSTATEGATIYYTIDGNEPTRSSTEYSEPIKMTEKLTIKAIAVKAGMTDSEMIEEHYTILPQVSKPVADPAGGAVTSGTPVELTTATSGATIYYTMDGNEPTRGSTEYISPIEMTEELTIKAIAVKAGMTDSEMMEEHYRILPPEQVAQPVANPEGGELASGTLVELTTTTADATIYYTIDGSIPSVSSTEYAEAIEVTAEMTIQAIAVNTSMLDSEMMTEHYTIATIQGLTSLTASAGNRSVTLKWDDATGKDSVTYTIYQVEGSSAPVDPANWKLVQSNVTENFYTVTGLTNGKTYSFAIKANYEEGVSDFSNVMTVTPRATRGNGGSGGGGGSPVLSGDAHLADLQIWADGEKLELSPAFASTPTEYRGRTRTEQVEIVVRESHSKAKVKLKDKILTNKIKVDLEEGDNAFVLTVQAENGTEKKYTVTITREEALKPLEPIKITDIDGHWAEKHIERAVVKEIIEGYPDGTFRTNSPITRAEFTVMLDKALQLEGEGFDLFFIDNEQIGSWAEKSVAKMVQMGIIRGYEDGSYRPKSFITRTEMAVMLSRTVNSAVENISKTSFADDESIATWAKSAVEAMKQAGIIEGRRGNHFMPNETATRAEAVVMILRMLDRL